MNKERFVLISMHIFITLIYIVIIVVMGKMKFVTVFMF